MPAPSPDDLALQRRLAAAGSRDERRQVFADHMTQHPHCLDSETNEATSWFRQSEATLRSARTRDLSPDTQAALASHYGHCGRLLAEAQRRANSPDARRLQALVLHHVSLAMTHVALIKQPEYVAAIAKSVGAQIDTSILQDIGRHPDVAVRIFTAAFRKEDAAFPQYLSAAAPHLLAPFHALHEAAAAEGAAPPAT